MVVELAGRQVPSNLKTIFFENPLGSVIAPVLKSSWRNNPGLCKSCPEFACWVTFFSGRGRSQCLAEEISILFRNLADINSLISNKHEVLSVLVMHRV